ncbi:hypothetical protein HGG64_00695 [Mycoplasma phocoeninasale]|uniref:Mycoplasma lipoprotein C-terminal domain-containing protein n=1 Tax=Mycoplasma phocoeninasale TaxID=2726117 RepID=A0A858U4P5_9MOLU|nr:hypothetical protein [Mycoplasma phocoeninasale]QJG66235.1 hypothetical protein HGG64_00695 [Mycoplasma phocoeninasale]
MKFFKIFKSFGILSIVPFSVTLVSCINKKNSDAIIFKIPYDKERESKPFYDVVNVYNNLLEQNSNNYLPVEIEQSKNRNLIYHKIRLDLSSKNEYIPNLVLYYPSLANTLYGYQRSLNFHDLINESNIDKKFIINNQQINTLANENILLPFSVSGESLVINNILLGMFLYEGLRFLEENDIKITLNLQRQQIFLTALNYYRSSNGQLKETTKKFWMSQDITFNSDKLREFFTTVDDLNFKSNFGLINLATKIAHTFSQKDSKVKIETFHIRSINNFVYSLLFNHAKSSYANFFLKRKANGLLDYSKVFKIGSEENEQLKWAFDYIKSSLINSKISLYNSESDANPYISTKMFALTSTRFFELLKNNKTKKIKEFQFLPSPNKNDVNDKNESFLVQGNSLIGISKTGVQNRSTINFVNWMYNKNNIINWKVGPKILKFTPVEYIAYKLGYIFPSDNFIKEYAKMTKPNLANREFLLNAKRENTLAFQEPVDNQSDAFRKNIALVFSKYLYNNLETATFSEFLFNLKKGIFGE